MKNQILVHDDERVFVNRYAEKLRSVESVRSFDVIALTVEDFRKEMEVLTERQRALRNGKGEYHKPSKFDTAAIFVVDFDLLRSDPKAVWNSEIVAYLTRCFSNCGLIVGLNLPTCYEFDLTLRGNLDSYADLNIASKQLANPGLWANKMQGFRPWYWPQLISYLESFDKKVRDVREHFDDPIWEVVGMQDIAETLPKSVIEFVGRKDPLKTTFRDFIYHSSNGLRRKDKNPVLDTICRIAAARISKWLERRVLPGQNTIVDAPHLVSRHPSLLRGDHSRVGTWNGTAALRDFRALALHHSVIEQFRCKKTHWFSRPVWFWRKIAKSERIKEVSTPWEKEPLRYRFCEDASKFYVKRECKDFIAEVDSPYDRRYIRLFPAVDYQPRVRLLVE